MKETNSVFNNDVDVVDGVYGEKKKDRNGNDLFIPRGNAVEVEKIQKCLESHLIVLILKFVDITGEEKRIAWSRADLLASKIVKLAGYGVQVQQNTAQILVKVIENSERLAPIEYIHTEIGWYQTNKEIIFRGHQAIGGQSTYHGDLHIKPAGSYDKWIAMVNDYVLGNPALEVALAIGFSATVYGYMRDILQTESLFAHYYGDSSAGKTTAGLLALSIGSYPGFDKPSFTYTWLDTENALLRKLSGNSGYPVLIDEASMSYFKNKTSFIYALTSGREKDRLNKDLSQSKGGSWSTTVISTGETSWLDNANENIGLRMRLLEFSNTEWTQDAYSADQIRKIIKHNYGHAIGRFAEGLKSFDKKHLKRLWRKAVQKCENRLEDDKFNNRIAKKYATIYLSAAFAKRVLGIQFTLSSILDFLCENDRLNQLEDSRDIGEKAFEALLEELQIHHSKFEVEYRNCSGNTDFAPKLEMWGKIFEFSSMYDEELEKQITPRMLWIFPEKLKSILKKRNFESLNIILKHWHDDGLLLCDESDRFRSRVRITSNGQRIPVYKINLTEY